MQREGSSTMVSHEVLIRLGGEIFTVAQVQAREVRRIGGDEYTIIRRNDGTEFRFSRRDTQSLMSLLQIATGEQGAFSADGPMRIEVFERNGCIGTERHPLV